MHRQNGFITPSMTLTIVALALCAAIVAGGYAFTNSLISKGHKAGFAACEKDYGERDKKQLEETLTKVVSLQKAKDKIEEEAKAESSALQRLYKEKLDENRALASRNKFLVGSLGVRNDAFVSTANCYRGAQSETSSSAAGSDGSTGCDLSTGAKQRLRDIGLRADKTAIQLSSCQQLLLSNLRICNAD